MHRVEVAAGENHGPIIVALGGKAAGRTVWETMMTTMIATLAQQNGYGGGSSAAGALGGLIVFVIWLAIIALFFAGLWKTFTKAGQPGWAAIVPIFNLYIMCKIAGKPWWWLLLFFVPIVSIVIAILLGIAVAKAFGKSALFGVGLALLAPIFYGILGFGSAEYQGPQAS